MLVLEDSYQTSVPPLLPSLAENGRRVVLPIGINVSLELTELLGVNEKESQIEANSETTLKWYDHRVNFYILKKEIYLNHGCQKSVESKQHQGRKCKAIMHVDRKGNSTPSGTHIMDETDIFRGLEKFLLM